MFLQESKYLMDNGKVRIAKSRPSHGIHRSDIDVALARLKMYKSSLLVNGFIVNGNTILRDSAAKKYMAKSVHLAINKFIDAPRSSRERTMAKERCSIAYNNGFVRHSSWSTLINYATEAFVLVKLEANSVKSKEDVEKSAKRKLNPYVAEFSKIVKRVGLFRFEQVLRKVETSDYSVNELISEAILA